MYFKMPQYEVKYKGEEQWQDISELELIDALYKAFNMVTPAIKDMIMGKQVSTPTAVYRLKDQRQG